MYEVIDVKVIESRKLTSNPYVNKLILSYSSIEDLIITQRILVNRDHRMSKTAQKPNYRIKNLSISRH